ncbi:MAG TPA: sensor domain-containing diguanylate cyclase [Anaerolineales bacterium]|nr:sensor domain-containing diguanylate cyclase [Anaerolineales bacterium]
MMSKEDTRLEVLKEAQRSLAEAEDLTAEERDSLLKLLHLLIDAGDKYYDSESRLRKLAGDLISNHGLLLMLQQQSDELDTLKKLSLNLTSSLNLPTVLDAVVTEAIRLVKKARAAHIFLYNPDGNLEFGAAINSEGVRNQLTWAPRKEGLTYTVARSGEQIVVDDMGSHPSFKESTDDWEGSIIGIPLKFSDNVVGVMDLSKSVVGGFSPSELRLLGLLADQAAVAISNASLHQMVSAQAYTDTVTGIHNRRALDDHLEQEVYNARRNGYSFAVIMMDLDGFKEVNDTYGHATGDQVLRVMSNYLAILLRSSDFLVRYGGDEFTLILSKTDPPAARLVMEKVLEKVKDFSFDAPNGDKIKLGLSAGIAFYPVHALTAADLLRASDDALYQAKKHNRGSYAIARGFTGQLPEKPS